MYAFKYSPSHIFENVGGLGYLLGHLLIDGQVVHTFQQIVALGSVAYFNLHTQIDVVAVANHFFEVVATVRSAKLHPFKFYGGSHFSLAI